MTAPGIPAVYEPLPGSVAARAIAHLLTLPPGAEVASGPLAEAIDSDTNSFTALLEHALRHGAVRKRKRGNLNFWSLGDGKVWLPLEDEPDEEEAPTGQGTVTPIKMPSTRRHPLVSLLDAPAAVVVSRAKLGRPKLVQTPPAAPAAPWPSDAALAWRAPPGFDPVAAHTAPPPVPQQHTCAVSAHPPAPDTPAKDAEAAQASSHLGREKGATPNDGAPRQQPGLRIALWSDGQLVVQRGGDLITFTVDETRQILRYLERMAESEAA